MKALRDKMRQESGRIWRDKARAEQLGLSMNEETITETLLFNLAKSFQGNGFLVVPFTKLQEAKSGADWEMWFVHGPKAFGLRVQAKRLFKLGPQNKNSQTTKKSNYNSLDPKGVQNQVLIKEAGYLCPVYALYNDRALYPALHPRCACSEYHGSSYLGCTIALASEVAKLNDNKAPLKCTTIPLHCLLCDKGPNDPSQSLPQIVSTAIKEMKSNRKGEPVYRVVKTPDFIRTALSDAMALRSDGLHFEPVWLSRYLDERSLAGILLVERDG